MTEERECLYLEFVPNIPSGNRGRLNCHHPTHGKMGMDNTKRCDHGDINNDHRSGKRCTGRMEGSVQLILETR